MIESLDKITLFWIVFIRTFTKKLLWNEIYKQDDAIKPVID